MRIGFLIFTFASFFLFSCGRNKVKIPLEEEKMVKVLADIHLAEAAMQNLYGTGKDTTSVSYYREIYAIHGINHALFDSSMSVMRHHPDYAVKVYRKVMAELENRKNALE